VCRTYCGRRMKLSLHVSGFHIIIIGCYLLDYGVFLGISEQVTVKHWIEVWVVLFLSVICPIIYSRFFSVLVMFCLFSGIKKIVQKLKNIHRHLHTKKIVQLIDNVWEGWMFSGIMIKFSSLMASLVMNRHLLGDML